jgi:hypothetical protein
MAVGLPLKTTYADGDVYSASDVNDTNGTVNLLQTSTFGFAAGKNKLINGDFAINQRAFTSTTGSSAYTFDRWQTNNDGGTVTITQQAFTAGTAPVAGYEAKNFLQIAVASQTLQSQFASITQKIESVRTLANSTATVSFWAKASSGTPKVAVTFQQNFGTGGSPSASVQTIVGSPTLSTSWARYSVSVTVPSISGKTIGTNNNDTLTLMLFASLGTDNSSYGTIGLQNTTIQLWGVQVEQGSTDTAFQTASGTIGGELALCQRYYWRSSDTSSYANYGIAYADQTNSLYASIKLPVTMRVKPTSVDYSTLGAHLYNISVAALSSVTLDTSSTSRDWGVVLGATTGLTQFRPYGLNNNNSTSGYIGFSAEL